MEEETAVQTAKIGPIQEADGRNTTDIVQPVSNMSFQPTHDLQFYVSSLTKPRFRII